MAKQDDIKRIGFIGLGNIGKPIAINLVRAGCDVTVYDVRAERLRDVEALGAIVAHSSREVAEHSDVVFVAVLDDGQVEAVILGQGDDDGLLVGLKPGSIIVVHSTVSPQICQSLAVRAEEKGVWFVDAPVSGAERGATDGTLTLLAGGRTADIDRCRPLFDVIGDQVFHLGKVGAGQAAKLCNNVMFTINLLIVEEALSLARAAGIDENQMLEIARVSTGNSWVIQNLHDLRDLIVNPRQSVSASELGLKDLSLALKLGQSLGTALPFTRALRTAYARSL